jgi:hypothetical protein
MSYEITGKLVVKYDTAQKSETFKTREFVIEKTEDIGGRVITNYVKFQCVQDKTSMPDRFNIGDEITSVDGKTPQAILAEILKYRRSGTTESDNFFMFSMFSRPSYMTSLAPKKSIAEIDVKRVDGSVSKVEIPWELRKYNGEIDKVVNVISTNIKYLSILE